MLIWKHCAKTLHQQDSFEGNCSGHFPLRSILNLLMVCLIMPSGTEVYTGSNIRMNDE